MQDRKKLIYIYGLGRSGSTLLGQILGQSANSTCIGEFLRFASSDDLSRAFDVQAEDVRTLPCSCGKVGADCEDNALTRYLTANGLHKVHRYFSLSGTKRLPLEIGGSFFISVRSIMDSYDKEVIVDTSKNPRLLFHLGKSDVFADYDVIGIFIYRNVREVWKSWRTDKGYLKKKSRLTILKNIAAGLLWSLVVFVLRYPKDIFVNFSRLRQNPDSLIGQLNSKLDIHVAVAGKDVAIINHSHEVAGNPSKLGQSGFITIK